MRSSACMNSTTRALQWTWELCFSNYSTKSEILKSMLSSTLKSFPILNLLETRETLVTRRRLS